MNKKRKYWAYIILLLLFCSFIIINTFITINKKNELQKKHKYTLAKIIKIDGLADGGGPEAYYIYYIGGKQYKGWLTLGYNEDVFKLNKRFFTKFNPNNPKNAVLLITPSVPDSIMEAPIMGWDTLPNGTH